jgi:maltose/moltooligosaccharide transporter
VKKKHLSFWQMFNLNFGYLGIQFGWGLQMANMSGIYKFLGASASQVGYLWVFAPLTGMLIQPILGQMSDRTWVRWLGRRRPYILGGAFVSTVALILMPHSDSLFMAAILLFMLDSSVNIAMQPYRALVADVAPEEQHTKTFSVQTFLVGIGGTLASALPWILLNVFHLVEKTSQGEIPLSIRLSFYIGAAVFLLANIWTVFSSREYPPEDMQEWKEEKKKDPLTNPLVFLWRIFAACIHMPKLMREIAWVNFFTWIAWFCIFLYYSLAIAQNIFNLPPAANVATSVKYAGMMEHGVALFGLCSAIYVMVSFVYALLIPRLNRLLTRKGTHIFSLICGGAAMISSNFIHTTPYLFLDMVGIGIAWASTVTIPYAMLAGSLPEDKMGVYMGIFNITVCLPEIIASLLLGFIALHVFHSYAMHIIVLGGVCFLIAAMLTIFVHDKDVKEEVF